MTLYDSSGKVVDFMQNESYPKNISADEIATFGMTYNAYFYPTLPPSIASYSLTAESNNYGLNSTNLPQSPIPIEILVTPSVQELPVLSILPLFLVILLIIVFVLKKKRNTDR